MKAVRQGKELLVAIDNKIGGLGEIAKTLAVKGINIHALHGTTCEGRAYIRLLTDDNLRAGDALKAKKFHVCEEECVLLELPNKPGMLRKLTTKLAGEGIDIYRIYATATEDAYTCLVSLACSDNARALVLLRK
jgi:hypothetical protein